MTLLSKIGLRKPHAPPVIISNNCWGAEAYRDAAVKYVTPTVGLWFYPDHYLEFLANLPVLANMPLDFIEKSSRRNSRDYPVGVLGNIEIQFMHYASEEEARRKWTDRCNRLLASKGATLVKICDRDNLSQEQLRLFSDLPFENKIAFLKKGKFNVSGFPWAVEIETADKEMPDGLVLWEQTKRHPKMKGFYPVAGTNSFSALPWKVTNKLFSPSKGHGR